MPVEKTPQSPQNYGQNLTSQIQAASQKETKAQQKETEAQEAIVKAYSALYKVKNELATTQKTWIGYLVKWVSAHSTFLDNFLLITSSAYAKETGKQLALRVKISQISLSDPNALENVEPNPYISVGKAARAYSEAITAKTETTTAKTDLQHIYDSFQKIDKDLFGGIGGFGNLPVLPFDPDEDDQGYARIPPDKMDAAVMSFKTNNGKIGFAVKVSNPDGRYEKVQTFYQVGSTWKTSDIGDDNFIKFPTIGLGFLEEGQLGKNCAQPFAELRELLNTGTANCKKADGSYGRLKLVLSDKEQDVLYKTRIEAGMPQYIAAKEKDIAAQEKANFDASPPAIRDLFGSKKVFDGMDLWVKKDIDFTRNIEEQLDESAIIRADKPLHRFTDGKGRIGFIVRATYPDRNGKTVGPFIQIFYQHPDNPQVWKTNNPNLFAYEGAGERTLTKNNGQAKGPRAEAVLENLKALLHNGTCLDFSRLTLEPKIPLALPVTYPQEGTYAAAGFAKMDEMLGGEGALGKLEEVPGRFTDQPTVEQMTKDVMRYRFEDGTIGVAIKYKERAPNGQEKTGVASFQPYGGKGSWTMPQNIFDFSSNIPIENGQISQRENDKRNFEALKTLIREGNADFHYTARIGGGSGGVHHIALASKELPVPANVPREGDLPRPAGKVISAEPIVPAAGTAEANALEHIKSLFSELSDPELLNKPENQLQLTEDMVTNGIITIKPENMGKKSVVRFYDDKGRMGFALKLKDSANHITVQTFYQKTEPPGTWATTSSAPNDFPLKGNFIQNGDIDVRAQGRGFSLVHRLITDGTLTFNVPFPSQDGTLVYESRFLRLDASDPTLM